eukprot:Skav223817  [mRNA]  locus=scaffold575:994400:994702:+ [translate_table: standard]
MGSGASQPPKTAEFLTVPEDIWGSQTVQRSQRIASLEVDDIVRIAARTAVLYGKEGAQRTTRVTSLNVEDLGIFETTDSPVSHTESGSQSLCASLHFDGA